LCSRFSLPRHRCTPLKNPACARWRWRRIGDLAVCGIPFETFVETGLDLKMRSPFPQTMVIGLANGRHGYLPTSEQHALGGYETWLGTNVV